MVPVCDKRYHIYNRFRHFWAEIKKLWNYPLCAFSYPVGWKAKDRQTEYTCRYVNWMPWYHPRIPRGDSAHYINPWDI